MKKRIFLDYASITPLEKQVKAEIERVEKVAWANPSSLHSYGDKAKTALEEARVKIAKLLHCRSSEIYFTSGGTESLNTVIFGVFHKMKKQVPLPHIIVSSIEHPAVLEPIKFMLKRGKIEASFISPNEKGIISPDSVARELKQNTILVIVQHANNEIGVIQPIAKIASMIKQNRKAPPQPLPKGEGLLPYFLVDASQSALYENVSLERLRADMLVIDGIKIYGPRGAGVLVVRHGTEIEPIIFGGGQENGLRSGTENVPAAAGLAKALELARRRCEKESKRLKQLRDYAIGKILKEIPNASLNGSLENRLPNNINICLASPKSLTKAGFPIIDSEFLVIKLDTLGFAVSAASACSSLNLENGSYVIESLGRSECKNYSLRITLGLETKKQDLDKLIIALKKILN